MGKEDKTKTAMRQMAAAEKLKTMSPKMPKNKVVKEDKKMMGNAVLKKAKCDKY